MKIKSTAILKKIMKSYYRKAKLAWLFRKKIAWITSGAPVEPLIAMGIIPIYPENHGAMIGASKQGAYFCSQAEKMGYSSEICSYARADIGCSILKGGPVGGLPKPDMLICCNNICGTVLKWYEVQARYYNVPLFIFDAPFCHTEFSHEAENYLKEEFYEYIDFLEKVCRKKFDYDKFDEVARLSLQTQRLWQAVLDTAINKPAPISAFDAFFHLSLIVTLRGEKIAADYYSKLLTEMQERAANKIGIIKNEKYRLLWDNLPIWFRMRWLSDKFASYDACIVADTYTSAWCGAIKYIDENNFLESMSFAYSRIYLNIGVDLMADMVIEMIDKYGIDGFIMHSNRSCKPYSLGQYDIARIVRKKRDIPVLIIESDMTDERNFSESQIENRIDAFMEMMRK